MNPAILQARLDACSEICGPTVDCETWCEDYGSCGNFGGGAPGGWCAGYCGDDYCNSANSEDYISCFVDCGYCGDGFCDLYYEVEDPSWCSVDCGDGPGPGPQCTPGGSECGGGQYCAPDGTCQQQGSGVPCDTGFGWGQCGYYETCCAIGGAVGYCCPVNW